MRDILTVTYIPKEQEDQSYINYKTIHTISDELEPIELDEVLGLYLTVIDDINLRIRATIGADHDTIIKGTQKYELLLGTHQKMPSAGHIQNQSTIINKIGEEKSTGELSLIQTFNKACHLVLAINDGLLNEIPKNDSPIFIDKSNDLSLVYPESLKNIARIFADKM